MNYIKEKKNKVKDLVEEKKEDATRYANERINAVKEYMEKNGKKIKKSATALALAGLTTLSATTMSGCEDIKHIFNPDETAVEEYVKPTTRTEEEIAETGITAEDVLAEFDNLVWDINNKKQIKAIYTLVPDEADYYLSLLSTSAKFVKITTSSYGTNEQLPFYGINTSLNFHNQGSLHYNEGCEIAFLDTYPLRIYYHDISNGHAQHSSNIVGAYKDQFQPIADKLSPYRCVLTEDIINKRYTRAGFIAYDYLDQVTYDSFDITRETIENASEEELHLLYDLAKSIRSISLDLKYPDNISNNQNSNNEMENN